MQYEHVLKKLNFDHLTPMVCVCVCGGGGWGLRSQYLLPHCCIRDYIKFDMQHDFVLKS